MGRDCCSEIQLQRKGPWTAEEDELLMNYIHTHGEGLWKSLPHRAGLLRCGKSCRLRWMNYLRPNIRRGNITPGEDDIIIRMHMLLGNRWSLIAGRLPGRTDNEIKNYWNSHLSKRLKFRSFFPLGTPQLPSRHGKNYPDLNGPNSKGDINNKNVVDADDHVYDNDPKYKKCHGKKDVESTQRVKIFTPKPIRIGTPSSSTRVEVLAPKPIRVTGSAFSSNHFMTDMHANNITSAIGNANNNSCIGLGENCKILVENQKKFPNEEVVEEKNHRYEVCSGDLGIDDRCWRVPYQGDSEILVTNEPRTLEMVYEEYLQLLESGD